MRLTERIHLIGSGEPDLLTTDPIDSQVYLIEAEGGHVVVDGGAGRSVDAILANVAADGLDPADIGWLLITHAHGDHAGAGPAWRARVPGLRIGASDEVAGWLEAADEEATSVDRARRAGIYPEDYRLTPCEVDLRMADGTALELGRRAAAHGGRDARPRRRPSRVPARGGRAARDGGGPCSAATRSSRAG